MPISKGPLPTVQTQRTVQRTGVEKTDRQNLERQVRQLLANKVCGDQVGIWLLIPEHLRLGTWDLLCGWSKQTAQSIHPRMALHLVHEAALCTQSRRYGRSLSQRGFEVANGLPWVPSDAAVHGMLAAHSIAESEALQIALGQLRRASGHFEGSLLAVDPHRIRTWSKRQMRRHRSQKSERPTKVMQMFFLIDAATSQPVAFTLHGAAPTVTHASAGLFDMGAAILGPLGHEALALADAEHYSTELLDYVHLHSPFELMVPIPRRGRHLPGPTTLWQPRSPGYATAKEPFLMPKSACPHPYLRYLQRYGEIPSKYSYSSFLCTADRDEVADLTINFPKRWNIEEFLNLEQALGWQHARTFNLNIRYAQMSFALIAQAVIFQLRRRLGSPCAQWNASHLARNLFGGLEGDVRVHHDTILVTYYNAPQLHCLRPHYQDLPRKLVAQGIDPRVPWLCDFKLDFRFR